MLANQGQKRRMSKNFGMRALEQFVNDRASNSQSDTLENMDIFIDNPLLHFQNSELHLEKQKVQLKEKIHQSSLAIEHFSNMAKELKSKKIESHQRLVSECLTALEYPTKIKSIN